MANGVIHFGWAKPDFDKLVKTHKDYNSEYRGAMLYAHYELSSSDLKKETLRYLKNNSLVELHERAKPIADDRFITVGKYFFIKNHKGDIPDAIDARLITVLQESIRYGERVAKKQPEVVTKVTPSIQDRLKEKTTDIVSEIEGWIDDYVTSKKKTVKTIEDFSTLLKTNNIKIVHSSCINLFERRLEEFNAVLKKEDKDLVDAYSHLSRTDIKNLIAMSSSFLSACNMLKQTAKITRKPIKKKIITKDKAVSKVKYMKEYTKYGLVSVPPVNILGAKSLWVYNTRTRKLGNYKAADDSGFDIKGTELLNYDATSIEKNLRNPEEILKDFKKANKVALRTFIAEIKAVATNMKSRLSEHHIILRVDK